MAFIHKHDKQSENQTLVPHEEGNEINIGGDPNQAEQSKIHCFLENAANGFNTGTPVLNFVKIQYDTNNLDNIRNLNNTLDVNLNSKQAIQWCTNASSMDIKLKDFAKSEFEECIQCIMTCSDDRNRGTLIENLKKRIDDSVVKQAHNLIYWCNIASAIVLMTTTKKLYDIFDEIKKAENITNESRYRVAELHVKIQSLKSEVEHVTIQIKNIDASKSRMIYKMGRAVSKLNVRHSIVLGELKNLQFQVKGKIESIESCKKDCLSNALSSGAQGVSNIIPALQNFSILGNKTAALSIGLSLALFAVSTASIGCFFMAEPRLRELRAVIDDIEKLNLPLIELGEILKKCDAVLDEFESE